MERLLPEFAAWSRFAGDMTQGKIQNVHPVGIHSTLFRKTVDNEW